MIVKKKTGEFRVCIDFRGLNGVTVNLDSYMLPKIDDTLDALAGAKFFCTLDLNQDYHQVELDEGLEYETALCYIDDIIVFGPTIESVLDRMTVLERLRAAKLKLKAKKCILFVKRVK